MEKLIRDINHDARAVTGQKNDVVCFGYQVGSHLNYYQFNPTDYPAIALEQLDMALEKGRSPFDGAHVPPLWRVCGLCHEESPVGWGGLETRASPEP